MTDRHAGFRGACKLARPPGRPALLPRADLQHQVVRGACPGERGSRWTGQWFRRWVSTTCRLTAGRLFRHVALPVDLLDVAREGDARQGELGPDDVQQAEQLLFRGDVLRGPFQEALLQ